MSNVLAGLALLPSIFIQFTDPRTGEPVYHVHPEGHPEAGQPDLERPVGVRAYGPGSKEHRAAQSAITNETIERKRRKVTAELIQKNAVELLARVTYEFVGFDYHDKPSSLENNRAFYMDDQYAHLLEQVQLKMGDYGGFLPSASTSS